MALYNYSVYYLEETASNNRIGSYGNTSSSGTYAGNTSYTVRNGYYYLDGSTTVSSITSGTSYLVTDTYPSSFNVINNASYTNGSSGRYLLEIYGMSYVPGSSHGMYAYSVGSVSYSRGVYSHTVQAEDGSYPDNGAWGDYWYVKGSLAIPFPQITGHFPTNPIAGNTVTLYLNGDFRSVDWDLEYRTGGSRWEIMPSSNITMYASSMTVLIPETFIGSTITFGLGVDRGNSNYDYSADYDITMAARTDRIQYNQNGTIRNMEAKYNHNGVIKDVECWYNHNGVLMKVQ